MIENKNLVLFYAISHTFEKFRRSLAGYRHLYSQRCVPQPCWTFKGGMRLSGTQFAILYFATLSIFMFSIPVRSQTSADYSPGNIAPPAEKYTISPGGVDMRTGHYVYRNTDLTIGTGVSDGGLKLERIEPVQVPGHINPFGNFSDNFDVMITERRTKPEFGDYTDITVGKDASSTSIFVSVGGRTLSFQKYNYVKTVGYQPISHGDMENSLTFTGALESGTEVYTLLDREGNQYIFRPLPLRGSGDCASQLRCALVSAIIQANGTRFDFQYETLASGGNQARLKSVSSNAGYQIIFEYSGPDWHLVSKSCLINSAMTAAQASCPTGVPSVSYTYVMFSGKYRLASVTDPAAGVYGFGYTPNPANPATQFDMAFRKPGQPRDWLTNTVMPTTDSYLAEEEITLKQVFDTGEAWTYNFTYAPTNYGKMAAK